MRHLTDFPESSLSAPHRLSLRLTAFFAFALRLHARIPARRSHIYSHDAVIANNETKRAANMTAETESLMTREDLAKYLNVSVQTIAQWKLTGLRNPPEAFPGETLIRYRRSEIDEWIASHRKAAE